MTDKRDLDALIKDAEPLWRGARGGENFLFDTSGFEGAVRHDYLHFLRRLGIPETILPGNRVHIHAGHKHPASLERRTIDSKDTFQLYLRNDLFRSIKAVHAAIAHELTHLFLVLNGLQRMQPGSINAQFGDDDEEIRTEVAVMALGFGKVALNGVCAYHELHTNAQQTAQLGYLPIESFAYVYREINDRVGVPGEETLAGLLPSARKAVQAV